MLKVSTDEVRIEIAAGGFIYVETPSHSEFIEWAELTPDQHKEVSKWTEKLLAHLRSGLLTSETS